MLAIIAAPEAMHLKYKLTLKFRLDEVSLYRHIPGRRNARARIFDLR